MFVFIYSKSFLLSLANKKKSIQNVSFINCIQSSICEFNIKYNYVEFGPRQGYRLKV